LNISIAGNVYLPAIILSQQEQEDRNAPLNEVQDWMRICQHVAEFPQSSNNEEMHDWSQAARAYPNLQELPSFIAQQRQQHEVKPTESVEARSLSCLGHSRNREVLLDQLPETSPGRPTGCHSSDWCSCIQCAWLYTPLPAEPACQGGVQRSGGTEPSAASERCEVPHR